MAVTIFNHLTLRLLLRLDLKTWFCLARKKETMKFLDFGRSSKWTDFEIRWDFNNKNAKTLQFSFWWELRRRGKPGEIQAKIDFNPTFQITEDQTLLENLYEESAQIEKLLQSEELNATQRSTMKASLAEIQVKLNWKEKGFIKWVLKYSLTKIGGSGFPLIIKLVNSICQEVNVSRKYGIDHFDMNQKKYKAKFLA